MKISAGKTEVESTSTQVLANANASLDRCAVCFLVRIADPLGDTT